MNMTYQLFAKTTKEMTCIVTLIDVATASYTAFDGVWHYSGIVDRFLTERRLIAAVEDDITNKHGV